MAFEPEKIDFSQINGGREYVETDMVSPSDFNALFKNGAFVQKFVDVFASQINVEDIAKTGTPSAELVDKVVNGVVYKILKLSNLKGETGPSGITDAGLSNEIGNSEFNGYTQKAINSLIVNENLLINGDFRVNQRGQTQYVGNIYGVDRWKGTRTTTIVSVNDNSITVSGTSRDDGIHYKLEDKDFAKIKGKKVTVSVKIKSISGSLKVWLRSYLNWNYLGIKDTNSSGILSLTLDVPSDFDSLCVYLDFSSSSSTTNSVEIEWVKLEVGSIATDNIQRPYAEELSMCQRYYQKLSFDVLGMATTGTKLLQLTVPTTTTLRQSSTIGSAKTAYIYGPELFETTGTLSINATYNNSIRLNVAPDTDLVIGTSYKVFAKDIGVDCEL